MDKQQEFALRTVEERDVRFIRLLFQNSGQALPFRL